MQEKNNKKSQVEPRPLPLGRAPKDFYSGSGKLWDLRSCRYSKEEALNKNSFRASLCFGFTLLELIITIIIIAVLTTVAVSTYQKATLKSRFNSLMPTTKAIRDGQEAYYLTNGSYANSISDLDIKTENTADMSITPGSRTDADLKYVFAARNPMNNHLIVYQKHSPKFSDHIHCEALKEDTLAQWLCADALHGQLIPGSVSGAQWDTYVIAGNIGPNDSLLKECPSGGETRACSCGSLQGSCNTYTGNWEYNGECPAQPASSQTCEGGKRQLRSVSCGANGWQTGEWSGCASEAAITAYEAVQEYDELVRQIQAAQEVYYAENGQYAIDLDNLGLTWPASCRAVSDHFLKCGDNLLIDNSLRGSTISNGFLKVLYCPGHNTGWYACFDVSDSITYYWYDHADPVSGDANLYKNSGGKIVCQGVSSLGTEMCAAFY